MGINFNKVQQQDDGVDYNFTSDVEEQGTINEEQEKSLFKSIASLPKAIVQSVTGEGAEIEFPEVGEIANMGGDAPGFVEGFLPNLQVLLARDDFGKAEILDRAYKDDERWGGAFVDKFNNPMIVWNEKPYYVNKPGATGTDFGTFVGETIKFLPATKFVNKAKTLLGTIARGVGAYSATESASLAGEAMMTPETTRAKERTFFGDTVRDVGTSTALGVGVDVAAPPIVKQLAKPVIKAGEKTGVKLPRFIMSKKPPKLQESQFELTVGQRMAEPPRSMYQPKITDQLEQESVIRNAPGAGGSGTEVLQGFDERQLDQIRNEAQRLQTEIGSGQTATDLTLRPGEGKDPTGAASEEIQSVLTKKADELKTEAGQAYVDARNPVDMPRMTVGGIKNAVVNALEKIKNPQTGLGITNAEISAMPLLKRELDFLQKLLKTSKNPRFKDQSLNVLHGYQKKINRTVRSAEQGSPEQLALSQIKTALDDAIFKGIDEGFIYGDPDALVALKKATTLYKDYMGLTGKGKGGTLAQRSANKILQKLTDQDYTPRQVANILFGHAKFAPNQALPLVIDKLKKILPEEESAQVLALLKDGIIEKAFSGSGKSGVTRTNIVQNYDDVFVKQKAIINKLFNEDELKRIAQFRKNVMPTLWADIKINPSGSSYLLLSAMTRGRLLSSLQFVPIVGEQVVGGIESMARRNQAYNMIKQYVDRTGAPLFSGAVQGALRPTVVETIADSESPALNSIIEGLNQEERERLLEAQ
tara:strand:+ start:666 stop:2939 length:2274 start_codon:yes stop_codon:yes gene_type:complete